MDRSRRMSERRSSNSRRYLPMDIHQIRQEVACKSVIIASFQIDSRQNEPIEVKN